MNWPGTPRRSGFAPDELRGACRGAGERLGREDARAARFRSAAEMVGLWGVLDLPVRVAPYALRDARLGYIEGYASVLVSEELFEGEMARAAEARWGGGWREKLEAAVGGRAVGGRQRVSRAVIPSAGSERAEVEDGDEALQHAAVTLRPADQDGPAREGCVVSVSQTDARFSSANATPRNSAEPSGASVNSRRSIP
jgi:hypothetical protein